MIKAQCHWAKDIEHFSPDKLKVLEIEELFISSDLTPFSLTFNFVKIELLVTMKMIFFFSKMAHITL